jgi:hypothetical protein
MKKLGNTITMTVIEGGMHCLRIPWEKRGRKIKNEVIIAEKFLKLRVLEHQTE